MSVSPPHCSPWKIPVTVNPFYKLFLLWIIMLSIIIQNLQQETERWTYKTYRIQIHIHSHPPHHKFFFFKFLRLKPKKLENLPRRNTQKGTGTKERPVFGVWIFSETKKVKKRFSQQNGKRCTRLKFVLCYFSLCTVLLMQIFRFSGGRLFNFLMST